MLLAQYVYENCNRAKYKQQTGDTSDENNYGLIALVTAASNFLKLCLSVILENYLFTHDQQFGFKSKRSTDFSYTQ